MTEPLTAGDPLTPEPPGRRRKRDPRPPRVERVRRRGWLLVLSRIVGVGFGVLTFAAIVGVGVAYVAYSRVSADLPDVAGLRGYQPRVMSRVYAGDARLMAELATERRIFVPFAAIPERVKQAFVSAEDQNYWVHRGVDPLAIARATVTNLAQYGRGKRPVGASTITQQVAKNMLLDNQLSLERKVREAILALRIEDSLSKQRILELYLNEIYLGLQAYGVAAAAQTYFDKPLDDLTLAEAAFLAALPKAPNNYNPIKFPEAARSRRDWVIDRMVDDHAVTPAEAREAKAQPVVTAAARRQEPVPGADWFSEEVRRRLIDRFGADTTTQGGLVVRTSLDPTLQVAAEHAVREGLLRYDRQFGGWRGAPEHIDADPALRSSWAMRVAALPKPPGMLPAWRLAVVMEETNTDARLGWLERSDQPGAATSPHTGTLLLSDLAWARPVRDGHMGGTPKRMSDVVVPGDLVMVEPTANAPDPLPTVTRGAQKVATGAPAPSRADRVLLRQVPAVQGALVTLDPTTGRVLAMVGGWSFENSQFNRATQANRQPGSSFKPMVYLTAMEQGLSPSQLVLDAPFELDQGAAGVWRPSNYGKDFNGPTPIRIALEKSLNLVTVRIAQNVGMEAVAKNAIAFHVVDEMPRVLAAALGAVDTTVLRQAGAYGSLSQGGREVVPSLIDSVQDRDGHVVWRAPGRACDGCDAEPGPRASPKLTDERRQIADPESVFQLVTMMQGVVAHGTGYEAGKGLNRAIAGKTGTSQDFNDAWFVGFTPDLVTAVWLGFDQPSSLGNGETGGTIAAPIWRTFMMTALKDRPNLKFTMPPGLTLSSWDSGSGSVTDAFKPGQTPGASGPIIGGDSVASADGGTGGAGIRSGAGGVDANLGGLY